MARIQPTIWHKIQEREPAIRVVVHLVAIAALLTYIIKSV